MSLDAGYFDKIYAISPDPWGFTTRWYEARKYAISLALLPREHYGDAFEPGCSVGVFTELLAPRCDRDVYKRQGTNCPAGGMEVWSHPVGCLLYTSRCV